jgi:hypothetical protein
VALWRRFDDVECLFGFWKDFAAVGVFAEGGFCEYGLETAVVTLGGIVHCRDVIEEEEEDVDE